jgi:hypothetical protein
MKILALLKFLVILSLFAGARAGHAQDRADKREVSPIPKSKIWVFSFIGHNHNLASGTKTYKLKGVSSAVQVGYGHVADRWFTTLNLDIHSGPFKLNQSGTDLNFFGTGISSVTGWSLGGGGLRAKTAYGLAFGANYFDIIGRPNSSSTEVVTRINDFALMPSIFVCKLAPPRFQGNAPEQLVTRIEGYMLNLGLLMPILATYDQKVRSDAGTKRTQGRLGGYSVIMHLSTWLGI